MENRQAAVPSTLSRVPPMRAVTFADIAGSLRDGWADFKAFPLYGLAFGGVYALGGLLILYIVTRIGAPWMIIPLAIGFPLIAPFVAVGLYEISRRRVAGEPITRKAVFAHVFRQRERQLGWMAFVVLFIFWIWIYQVRLLLALFLGFKSFSSFQAFAHSAAGKTSHWSFAWVMNDSRRGLNTVSPRSDVDISLITFSMYWLSSATSVVAECRISPTLAYM